MPSSNRLMSAAHLAALALVLALAFGQETHASPQAIVTIDVESFEGLPLPQHVDPVCADGTRCGLMRIARMLEERGMAGTFFLNVYEYKTWGEPAMRDIVRRLQENGHEVALHTHPQWAYDPVRPHMYEYSLEEQTRIIADGVKLLEAWTGRPVVSHRAGAYTANRDTLRALARSGVRIDSSLFFKHPKSHLNGLGMPSNIPSTLEGVMQIPVTAYYREDRPAWLAALLPPVRTVRKIDPDWFINAQEARAAMDATLAADVPFLVVFLHSYSFIADLGHQTELRMDRQAEALFAQVLDRIGNEGLDVLRMGDIPDTILSSVAQRTDVMPSVAVTVPAYKYAGRWLRSHATTNQLITLAGVLALLAVTVFVLFIRYRQRRRLRASATRRQASPP